MIERVLQRGVWLTTFGAALFLVACGGGGGGSSAGGGGGVPATAAPPATSQSAQIAVSPAGGNAALPAFGGFSGTVALSSSNAPAGAAITATTSTTLPAGLPVLQSAYRQVKAVANVLFYESFSSPVSITFASVPGFTIALPSTVSTSGQQFYVALYASGGWSKGIEGPATVSGQTLTFAPSGGALTLSANTTYYFAIYSLPAPAAAVVVNPASLSFTSTGTPATVTVTESGYTGAFTATSTNCNGIATTAAGTGGQFNVTPVAAGTCSVTFADTNNNTVALPVTVTTTTVGGN